MSKPNKYQAALCATYGGGDYASLADDILWESKSRQVGDTLFLFLMIELSDDGEPMTQANAMRRLETALDDVESVMRKIDTMAEA